MGHVREYTTAEIMEFLKDIGFVVTGVIYRGRYSTGIAHILTQIIPSLNPFVSYIAAKSLTETAADSGM